MFVSALTFKTLFKSVQETCQIIAKIWRQIAAFLNDDRWQVKLPDKACHLIKPVFSHRPTLKRVSLMGIKTERQNQRTGVILMNGNMIGCMYSAASTSKQLRPYWCTCNR